MEIKMHLQSDDITTIAKALLKVQVALQPATKDATNTESRKQYQYATLNSVMEVCRKPLLDNGILLVQYPIPANDKELGLMTRLIHAESGQWIGGLMVIPLVNPDAQAVGSAMTYARRYSLSAMLGIVTADDDGEAAKQNVTQTVQEKQKDKLLEQQYLDALAREGINNVNFETKIANNGRKCIVATGNCIEYNEKIFVDAGFTWNKERKCWWKYEEQIGDKNYAQSNS